MIRIVKTPWLIVATILLTLLAGCSEPPVVTQNVQLSGQIIAPDDIADPGKVRVNLYHAWALEGELRHPLEFIESFETGVGDFTHSFEYPVEQGEGLVVYAWLDTDGDDVLCTPDVRNDLAGFAEVQPAEQVTVSIRLDTPCAGPDWFYPQATP